MAYQRVTLSQLRAQLDDRLKTSGSFWTQEEKDRGLNEAIAIWQAMTGDHVITVTQTLTDTTKNLVGLTTTDTNGTVLSVLRVIPAGGAALREMSLYELDQGFYGWRTETASNTTQRPAYWSPVGIASIMVYPRVGASQSYSLLCYGDALPLTTAGSYIDISEGELQRVLGMAQAILGFKEGVVDGTDNASALKELFIYVAHNKNRELMDYAIYKDYMGHDESFSEPDLPKTQDGLRG